MNEIIGREKEQKVLEAAYAAEASHFVVVYGRRRVGKTYLIRNIFKDRSGCLFFNVTGVKDGQINEQLKNFTEAIGRLFEVPVGGMKTQENWRDAFNLLTAYINKSDKKKIVLFFDEFPWMVTKNSRLLQMLEYFWNHHWSQDARIKLIICGSSAGWLVKNIINNRGGLYNRVTRRIHLEPFNLEQTKQFLKYLKISLTNRQVTDLYMVLGGIPFYLAQVERGLTAVQTIEQLAFKKNSFLMTEFDNLYATLFGAGGHIGLARIIAQHHYGIGQEELIAAAAKLKDDVTLSSGGTLVSWLDDLEQAGFIQRFMPYQHAKRGIYYKMIDEYSIFYFRWLEPIKTTLLARGMRVGYWEKAQHSPAWRSWAGYAFESICYKHIPQISIALKLSPTAIPYSWRYAPEKKRSKNVGAQIDLLFDRDDDAITICEIKYSSQEFIIDKDYAKKLQQKIDTFLERTKSKKQIFLAFVAANGLAKSIYSEEMVTRVVVLDDLFKNDE